MYGRLVLAPPLPPLSSASALWKSRPALFMAPCRAVSQWLRGQATVFPFHRASYNLSETSRSVDLGPAKKIKLAISGLFQHGILAVQWLKAQTDCLFRLVRRITAELRQPCRSYSAVQGVSYEGLAPPS